jgi:hypothetical protein
MNAGKSLLLALLLVAGNAQAAVTASVDRARISVSDSLVLTLRASEGESVEDTNLDVLALDFDVVSTGTSTRVSVVNGRTERSTDFQVVLLPRRNGELVIPPLRVDGQRTREIRITVTDAPTGLDNSRDVFVESEVNRESVYVQSQLIHAFRIYEAVDLSDRGRSELTLEEAVVEEIEATSFQRVIDGRAYRVYEVRHAIFPQKSGTLTIPSLSFNARKPAVRRSLFARGELIRRRSDPITVEVRPVPAAWPDAPWIPASSLKIEESWSTLPDRLAVGDSVTRTLTVVAEGIDGSQLPPVTQAQVSGIKMYPDQPRSENTRDDDGITGIGINSTALLITEPGEFLLPAVRVPWWDTSSNSLRYAEIPAKPIRVAAPPQPAAMNRTAQPAPLPANSAAPAVEPLSLWMWSTLAALLGWVGTTAWLLWRMRRPRTTVPLEDEDAKEVDLFRNCLAACNDNKPGRARTALQHWGRCYFGDRSIPTLQVLQERLDSAELDRALETLERSLYAGESGSWKGADLALTLKKCRKQRRARDSAGRPALPPLYSGG